MSKMSRRSFAAGVTGVALAPSLFRGFAIAGGSAKVVIIGGGPGGATVAVHLKRNDPDLDVTLVEPKTEYTTCFFSNHYIGGMRSFDSITHNYHHLKKLGVNVVHTTATGIDTAAKRVQLGKKNELTYDRLVVAPGIDIKFETIEGYSDEAAEVMPHAWKGGSQSRLLRKKLEALEDGDTVIMSVPRAPYRCPPGPYERACAIANYLKQSKPKSKLIILDAKMSYSKQPVFEEAFAKYYQDIVELHLTNDIDDFSVTRVDTRTGEVLTKAGTTFKGQLANIIPEQKAGSIAAAAGLTEGEWCPVEPENFASKKAADVYVLGDAAIADPMPKSAFSANSQGLVVAGDLLAKLSGKEKPKPAFRNTCWSFLAPNDSVKIGADYAPGEVNGKMTLAPSGSFVSKPGESEALRKENLDESLGWYQTLTGDIFGAKTVAVKG